MGRERSAGDDVELVAVEVGGQSWALPLAAVERVVAMVAVSPLPESPAGVRGAINVGGEIVPVLDLDLRIGRPIADRGSSGRLVLARTRTRRVALPVDEVLGVIAVEAALIGPPVERTTAPMAGVAGLPDGVLAIYDLDAFLSTEDDQALAVALEGGVALTLPGDVMAEARTLVRERLGLDFPSRREADLERALNGAGDRPRELLETLRAQPVTDPSWRALISALTVQESYFFRDAAFWAALAERVLPALIAERRAAGDLRLALWSAGCAEGQEPYSLAMLLDRLLPDRARWRLSIIGTDLDARSLDAARAGVYGDWALRDLPAWAARHFETREPKRHVVAKPIRAMVDFAPLNLSTDPYPGSLDLIVCRNVLMYLTGDARHAAVVALARALVPEGWLVVSPLDSTRESEALLLEPEEQAGVRFLRRRDSEPEPERQPEPAKRRNVTARPRPAAPPRTPAPTPSALERARAAADRGELDDAIALCLQALRDDPLDAEAHLLTAAVEEEREDLTAAIAAVRRAIYSAPDSPTAHFRLGSLLLRRGDEAAARRSLTTAAELFGDRAPASLLARVAP